MDLLIEIFRLISWGSKSVGVEPSSPFPRRVRAPAEKRSASTRDVLPTPPCPTTPTLRILPTSIVMTGHLPTGSRGAGNPTTGPTAGRRAAPAGAPPPPSPRDGSAPAGPVART